MPSSTKTRSPWFVSRLDFIATIVVAAAIAVGTVIGLVLRLIEVIPNRDVSVPARVLEETSLPLNGGSTLPVTVQDITLVVSDLPPATYVSVILSAILPAIATLIVLGGVLLLCRNLMTGRVFAPGNARTVGIVSLAIAAGWLADHLFSTMASNGAIAAASGRQLEAVSLSIDFMPIFVSMGVALVGAAFHAGGRLQRETEGLV